MIARALTLLTAGVVLAACQPAVPDSGRGVGFDDDFKEQALARDAALAGLDPLSTAPPVTASTLSANRSTPIAGSPAATAAETSRVLAATRPGVSNGTGNNALTNSGTEPLNASPSNPAPAIVNSAGISNENNFDAVADQRSIGDDAARLAANRSQYQVVQPEALPERSNTGPNIVAYALQTSHAPGTPLYRRIGLNKDAKYQRACAAFSTPDQAQIAFLESGGPSRDRQGMDPDGDGFACDWNPTPFRRAADQS